MPAGHLAERSLADTVDKYSKQYICIVEGSIPTAEGGVYCMVRGRTALSIAREVCGNALATIAVGSCAWDGGLAAAAPNPSGAVGVGDFEFADDGVGSSARGRENRCGNNRPIRRAGFR